MASGFVQTNGRVIAGEGDPAGGDALVTNLSLFPINSLYVNNNTGKLWVRNEENLVVGDWVGASSGPGGDSLFPTTGTGTATGAVVGDLVSNTLSILGNGNGLLTLDPTAGAEGTDLRAQNNTDSGNIGNVALTTTNTQGQFDVNAKFDGGADVASIVGTAQSGSSAIVHTADTHTFNADGEQNLFVSKGGSNLRAFDPTDDDNISVLDLNTQTDEAAFTVSTSFNGGVKSAEIRGEVDATTSSITHTADEHIFNLQNFANNAAAVTGGLSVGALYYTNTAGEGLVKIVL